MGRGLIGYQRFMVSRFISQESRYSLFFTIASTHYVCLNRDCFKSSIFLSSPFLPSWCHDTWHTHGSISQSPAPRCHVSSQWHHTWRLWSWWSILLWSALSHPRLSDTRLWSGIWDWSLAESLQHQRVSPWCSCWPSPPATSLCHQVWPSSCGSSSSPAGGEWSPMINWWVWHSSSWWRVSGLLHRPVSHCWCVPCIYQGGHQPRTDPSPEMRSPRHCSSLQLVHLHQLLSILQSSTLQATALTYYTLACKARFC